jgi:hypothetical protein
MRRLLVLIVLAVLGPAAGASAGTLSYSPCDDRYCVTEPAVYRAAARERNDVTYVQEFTGVTLRDAGAPVTPGAGCVAIDANAARCPGRQLSIVLGDGDDRAAPGPGVPYAASVRYDGGDGTDTLVGGPGADTLVGGPGRDTLDGGAGVDRVSYIDGPPVVVDLAGESTDALTGIEAVLGSRGPDVLRGDAGPNFLQGGEGDDIIDGRDGNDEIDGGKGFDDLTGGAGDDVLIADFDGLDADTLRPPDSVLDRAGEHVDCGPGTDTVSKQSRDVLSGCERLSLPLGWFSPAFDPRPRRAGRAVVVHPRCVRFLRGGRTCRVRITLSQQGRRIGSRTVSFTGTRAVRVPVSATDLGPLRVQLHYLGRFPAFKNQATTIYVYATSAAA